MAAFGWSSWWPPGTLTWPLPSLSIPSSIQRRFLSFVLRRAVGSFLAPGQLDPQQIDAQLGSGLVDVRDVELDRDGINAHLTDLPVRLQSGTVGKVTARVPWPNPLTSTIGLSLVDVHVIAVVQPGLTGAWREEADSLAQSVVEAAQGFVHDELEPREAEKLQQSIYENVLESRPPGSLDPFDTDEVDEAQINPEGVSVVVALLDRLLARFAFDAANLNLTVVYPGLSEFVVSLKRIEYSTQPATDASTTISRLARFTGMTVSTRDLRITTRSAIDSSSNSSSDDEQTRMTMTMSVSALPETHTSGASTMFQSALSIIPEDPDTSEEDAKVQTSDESLHVILASSPDEPIQATFVTAVAPAKPEQSKGSISITIPTLASMIDGAQLHALLRLVETVTPPPSASSQPAEPMAKLPLDIDVKARGVYALLMSAPHPSSGIFATFFSRPTDVVQTPHVRIHLDRLSASMSNILRKDNALIDITNFDACVVSSSGSCMPLAIVDPNLPDDKREINTWWADPSSFTAPNFRPSSWRVRGALPKHSSAQVEDRAPAMAITLGNTISVRTAPLHTFIDLAWADGLASFMNAMGETSSLDPETQRKTPPNEDVHSTPRPAIRELEGQTAPRHKKPQNQSSSISVAVPALRVEVTCPPLSSSSNRFCGPLVLDITDLMMNSGQPRTDPDIHVRFESRGSLKPPATTPLASIHAAKIEAAYAGVDDQRARLLLHAGSEEFQQNTSQSNASSENILVSIYSPQEPPTSQANLSLYITIPLLTVDLEKSQLDGLQYWLDGVTEWTAKRTNGSQDNSATASATEGTSILGSNYFGRRSSSFATSSLASESSPTAADTAFSAGISVAKLLATFRVQRHQDEIIRPFRVNADALDLNIEVKPEGRDETALSLAVLDVRVVDDQGSDVGACTLLRRSQSLSLETAGMPMVQLRFVSLINPESGLKTSRVRIQANVFTLDIHPDFSWVEDLTAFARAPEGAFESVVPSDRTRLSLSVQHGSMRSFAPQCPAVMVLILDDFSFSTSLVEKAKCIALNISAPALCLMGIDDRTTVLHDDQTRSTTVRRYWKSLGYALLMDMNHADFCIRLDSNEPVRKILVNVQRLNLGLHACADTLVVLGDFVNDFSSLTTSPAFHNDIPTNIRSDPPISYGHDRTSDLLSSLDEGAFHKLPDVGQLPDMISDDLPRNIDYLDVSFGTAAGVQELGEEFIESGSESPSVRFSRSQSEGIISDVGGETIRMLEPGPIRIIENFYDTLVPDALESDAIPDDVTTALRARECDVTLYLYDGYDWEKTRKLIEDKINVMRQRLARLRQLLANGQSPDEDFEETNMLLFNSVHIGLQPGNAELGGEALIAAIDDALDDDAETEMQGSWQSLRKPTESTSAASAPSYGRRLMRGRSSAIEIKLIGAKAEFDQHLPNAPMVSRSLVTVRDLEILDHIKTSTWKKFLTEMRTDFRGNIREAESNMVRIELGMVRPDVNLATEEARLRAKFLPLRLHVDQDALDFLKKFFAFRGESARKPVKSSGNDKDIFFQQVEVFPVDLKLDYKPKRVDYNALRSGKTLELMNFFHFDGAEMTLRHIVLSGITGWPTMFELLNDLWTPDVKANQLSDIISSISPIRSLVNVGTGVADLVLLPLTQYKKDQRLVRGVQRGTSAFVKNTAMEAIKLGARLASGTQVVLEQAEGVLGGRFNDPMTLTATDAARVSTFDGSSEEEDEPSSNTPPEVISKYAHQPVDAREGVQSGIAALRRNVRAAAQTILAVPMEVYERSGPGGEGPVRAVVRAVPIAVLRPMIGASEAVSKTLLGVRNTLDPSLRLDLNAKYKSRE